MPRRIRVARIGGMGFDEMQDLVVAHPVVLAGSCFVLGLATGMMLKDAARQIYARSRGGLWHREYERTRTYDENLPDTLARREPEPNTGQPRFGGTGALGTSPEAVVTARPQESKNRARDNG
jgi:hypothetical protein